MWLYPLLDEDDEEEEEDQEDQKKDSLDVSSKLMKTRTIIISEPVTAKLAQKVITQLLLLEQESDEDIIVVINSPGNSTLLQHSSLRGGYIVKVCVAVVPAKFLSSVIVEPLMDDIV